MPLSAGHWCSLPGLLYTGNTAPTHTHRHTQRHTQIFIPVWVAMTSPARPAQPNKGKQQQTSVPSKHTHTQIEESVELADSAVR